MADDLDFTDQYNTALSPAQEAEFQNWAKSQSSAVGRDVTKDTYDYDLRGWFAQNGPQPLSGAHLTDQWKKPNHPTFSTGSIYHGADGNEGGQWDKQPDGSWTFTPGSTNQKNFSPAEMQDYFNKVEPGNKLLPAAKKMGLGYDPNLDEINSGYDPQTAASAMQADKGMVIAPQVTDDGDASMEKNPALVPKQPLSQVPEMELDDDRPNFYQRQFPT